ncbi:similar to MALE GAMETOPHYTE DEFECTIVE 2 [Actinidia rufa]|uniref:Similar to MALE GAMETOPHYTE DEFECTIVE 2 n=1 Tax=Actinidia rufa TaxID=165716 RepID=A0A7J0EFL0_9ERIC|nr:similar to MALE GAMETOPHYTE DEFECTIVE 2 [Actinidia rufa]
MYVLVSVGTTVTVTVTVAAMAGPRKASSSSKRPALLHLVGAAAIFSLIVFAIQSALFTGTKKLDTNREEVRILSNFQAHVQQCVYNEQFKIFEPLEYNYDVCEAILLWEQKYAKYVGLERDFRLVVRGAARNMVTILNGSVTYGLDQKCVTHRDFNAMIKSIPNPVYLFQGIVFRRGAKGTGMKSIELALSMCDIIDIYGFTVDPGYTEWTRYFSTPRKGHNPLQGRAYYQLLECLGGLVIHSPMRAKRKQDWLDVPSREIISRVHAAALRLKRSQNGQVGVLGTIWKNSNYCKWEDVPFESLRMEAQDHYKRCKVSHFTNWMAISAAGPTGLLNILGKFIVVEASSVGVQLGALCFAPNLIPCTPTKNLSTPWTSLPKQASSRFSPIKATAVAYDISVVDYSSTFSVFPAEACETIGGEACAADMYPEVKLKPESRNNMARLASEMIEREYLEYNGPKTVLPGDACDILGGEFCERPYQRGVY